MSVYDVQVTLTREQIWMLAGVAEWQECEEPVRVEQRVAPEWTITRALLADGRKIHLGPQEELPKWLIEEQP